MAAGRSFGSSFEEVLDEQAMRAEMAATRANLEIIA
jgi:hypothetical protein